MKFLFFGSLFVIFLNACTSSADRQEGDFLNLADNSAVLDKNWECIAGIKAGMVTSSSSEQELIDKLGRENVSPHDTVFGAEGLFSIGTILYKGTPNEAHIVWKDTLKFANPEYVEVGFAEPGKESSTKWYTNTGVKVGTKLTELETINGGPFKFLGFDWDYGGAVTNWAGGKLMNKDSTSYLAVILAYDYDKPHLQTAANKLLGDSSFDSKNPNAQKLNPFVSHFIVSFR